MKISKNGNKYLGFILFFLSIAFVSLRTKWFYFLFEKDSVLGFLWHPLLGNPFDFDDFNINVYYPVKAFLNGENPYNWTTQLSHYPVSAALAPYLPYVMLIHFPLSFFSVSSAQILYYFISIALILVAASLTLKMVYNRNPVNAVLMLSALIIFSRPGQLNLLLGHLSLEFVIGTYVALFFARTNPAYSGLGLALSMTKPSFGLPLMVLMLANKNVRPVVIGIGISILATLCVLPFLIKAEGGLTSFIQIMITSYKEWGNIQIFDPGANVAIDLPSFVSRVTGMPFGYGRLPILFLVIAASSLAIYLLSCCRNKQAEHLSSCIICIAILVGLYHSAYDLLILIYPVTLLVCNFEAVSGFINSKIRWVMILLFFIVSFNIISSHKFLDYFQFKGELRVLLASINSFALFLLLLLYIVPVFFRTGKKMCGQVRVDG